MGQTTIFLVVNIIGGILVLGSYLICFIQFPEERTKLWGEVPKKTQQRIVPFMLLAAAGYLITSWWFWQVIEPNSLNLPGGFTYVGIIAFFALLLALSTAWMPVSVLAIKKRSNLWKNITICILLGVSIASCFILFLVCTATVEKNDISLGQVLAIIGWSFLCIQTVFWDGILWVLKFHPDRTSLA